MAAEGASSNRGRLALLSSAGICVRVHLLRQVSKTERDHVMRSFRQILEGYGKCVHCGKAADGGWANNNDVCKRCKPTERALHNDKKHRGHNSMPEASRRRMERRLG
jgi:hypothetical protein